MKVPSQFRRTLFFVIMLLILLTGVIAAAQDEQVLVIGHSESTDSLDPARGYTQTTGVVLRATYSTLVTFPDADASSIEPMLASEWDVSEDGLTYTFTLRDATFSSGNPVTANDVVFSFNRLKSIQGSPAFLAANIASVEAVDEKTVAVTLSAVDPSFLSSLPNSAFSIVDAAVVQENGGTDTAEDGAEDYLNDTSAGSGPYILESWEQQVQTVLVRNPNYWGTQPFFDRVIIVHRPEPATQKTELEAGGIDLALDLTSDQISGLEGNPSITISRGPANIVHFLLMNQNPDIGGPVSDPKVQQAIRYALDYDGYLTLWGGVQPGTNLVVGLSGAFGPDKALKRDLDMARQLLTEAGYEGGFEITLHYPNLAFQGVDMNTNAQKIQSDLAEIGITVSLNPQEVQVALEGYRTGQQGFAYWFWGPDKLDPSDFLSFLPGGKVSVERALWAEGVDQSVLDLIEQAKVETDEATRLDLYTQLQEWAQQNSPFAPFNQPDIQTAFRANIQGYVWHPQWLVDVALLSRS